MTTGEKAGLWGTVTNTNLDLVEQAVGGYVELSLASGNQTPAISDGAASDGRNKVIKLTGTLSANRSLIFPDSCEKTYLVIDGTTRSSSHYTITIKTSSGTGVVTGKYTHSSATTVVDIATYEKTGKTAKQHLYSKIFEKEKATPKTVLMYDDFKQKTYARLSSHQYYNEILAP